MTADRRSADLLAVLEISRRLAARRELQPLLEAIEQSALRVLDCERVSVFLHDAARGELFSRVATGVQEVRFPAGQGLAGEAFRTAALINLPNAYADARFNRDIDRLTGFHTRSLLTCPLLSWDNRPLGVIQALNKHGGVFEAWDEVLVQTLSAQAGVAVQRQLLLEEFAKKQRYERDLAVARLIQRDLLPRSAPIVAGFDIAGWNQPADETGGDFFDFLALDDGRLAITLGDVTGHGIGPALVAAECRALVRALASHSPDVRKVMAQANRLLADDIADERFVTAFFGFLTPETAGLEWLSAGHGPILFHEAATGAVRALTTHGIPLGIMADFPYGRRGEIAFAPGDTLLVLTDGFVEWPDGHGQRPGTEPVIDVLRAAHTLPAADLIQAIYAQVRRGTGGTPQEDDLTAVVIRRLPPTAS